MYYQAKASSDGATASVTATGENTVIGIQLQCFHLRMVCMDINKSDHARNSFAIVAIGLCEWALT